MLRNTLIQKIAMIYFIIFSMNFVFADVFINQLTNSTKTVYYSSFEDDDGGLIPTSSESGWDHEWGWGYPDYYDLPEGSGYLCWGTAIENNEYVNDWTNFYLETPMIGARKARISFTGYLNEHQDFAYVQFRELNGGWINLAEHNSSYNWTNFQFDTPEVNSDSIQFRFYYDNNTANNHHRGWYIDNLMLEKFQTSITHEPYADTYNPYGPYQIQAALSDSIDWLPFLKLNYFINGSEYIEDMVEDEGIWTFILDGQSAGTEISYFFEAADTDANTHILKKNESDNFSFSILEYQQGESFSMYQPANLSEDVDIYLLMQWTDLGDPVSKYTIQYGTDNNFSPGTYVEKSGLSQTEIYNPVDFIKDAIYYWRVFAVNPITNDTVWADNQDGDSYWQFEVIPPEVPSVLSGAVQIQANRTIIPENNPYFIQGDVTNYPTDTLTVRPGVICEFTSGSSFDIKGHLIAEGTEQNRIIFKAEEGATWDGIHFNILSPSLNMTNDFSYISGPKFTYCDFNNGYLNDGSFTGAYIEHCNFSESSFTNQIAYGYINGSNFINGSSTGLNVTQLEDYFGYLNNFKVENSSFVSNNGIGLHTNYVDSVTVLNSEFNYNSYTGLDAGTTHYFEIKSSNILNNQSYGIYNQSSTDFIVDLCQLQLNTGDGMYLTQATNVSISNSDFYSPMSSGAYIGSSSNITIIGSDFSENGDYGAWLGSSSNVTILESDFCENGSYGINSNDLTNVSISNSSFNNNNQTGFSVSSNSYYITIDSSSFNNNNGHGFYSSYVRDDVSISNAIFNENNGDGIFLGTNSTLSNQADSVLISQCQLLDNASDGFRGNINLYLNFSENTVFNNNDHGIYAGGSGDKNIQNNTVMSNKSGYKGFGKHIMTGNQFIDNGTYGSVFIEGEDKSGHYIAGNEIMFNENTTSNYGSYPAGLYLYQVNGATIEDNVISDNYKYSASGFWTGTAESGQFGASLAALNILGDNNLIRNNTISDNETYINTSSGNWNWSSSSDLNTGGNAIRNHGAGISMIGNNNTIYGNDIINNKAKAVNNENSYHSFISGGGVYAWGDSILIRKNNIHGNTIKAQNIYSTYSASAFGAGIYIEGEFTQSYNYFNYNRDNYALIDSNVVMNNQIIDIENHSYYSRGSGIYSSLNSNTSSYTAQTDIINNEISNNSFIVEDASGGITQYGTGVYLIDPGVRSRFSNNTVVGNTSEYGYGGGIYTSVNIDSSTVAQNVCDRAGGIYFKDMGGDEYTFSIDYSTITDNTARTDYGAIYNPTIITRSIIVGNKVIDNGQFNEEAIGGIYAPNLGQNLHTVHFSNIYGNTGYNIRLGSTTNVNAVDNWWNTRSDQIMISDDIWDGFDDPQGSYGVVEYQPFLTFSSDQTPGQIEEYIAIKVYADNTYQMQLGNFVNLDQRFFIEMEVVDGNENSIDISAVKVENLRTVDYIGPLVVETNLNTGLFRGSAVTSNSTNFVHDSLYVEHGDTIRISPYNYSDLYALVLVDTAYVSYELGDVNDDSYIDILDVMNIVNYILGNTNEINFYAADVNGDSYINLMDIIGVINIILGNPLARESQVEYAGIYLPEIYEETDDGIIVPIDISWPSGNIGGLEFTLESDNFEILDIHSDVDGVEIYYNEIDENKTKCLIVSLDDNIITVENYFQVFVAVDLQEKEGLLSLEEILISDQYSNVVSTVIGNNKTQIIALPEQFSLGNNYPNPFNPITKITLALPTAVIADVVIYNIRGQVIKNLIASSELSGGYHTIVWNGKDNVGREVASGIYVLKFISKEYSISRKMTLLR